MPNRQYTSAGEDTVWRLACVQHDFLPRPEVPPSCGSSDFIKDPRTKGVPGMWLVALIAAREGKSERSIRMTLSLAFIAPPLVVAAIEGRLPRGFGAKRPGPTAGEEGAVVPLPIETIYEKWWAMQGSNLRPSPV
jgi:hypothetical protein